MLFIMPLLRLSLASSGSENEGVTCIGIRGGEGLGGGGGGGGSGNTGGGGTGGDMLHVGDARILRLHFLFARGPLPSLSRTSRLTSSVCSSLSRFISCTLSVVSCASTGLIGDMELAELKLIDIDTSPLRGDSKLREFDLWKVSLADLQIAGE